MVCGEPLSSHWIGCVEHLLRPKATTSWGLERSRLLRTLKHLRLKATTPSRLKHSGPSLKQ